MTEATKNVYLNKLIQIELLHESSSIKKMIELVPYGNIDWSPHAALRTIRQMLGHIFELYVWVKFIAKEDSYHWDMIQKATRFYNNKADTISSLFEKESFDASESLEDCNNEYLMQDWTLYKDKQVYFTLPRYTILRSFIINHIAHHRGQLSIYFRMLGVSVPNMYWT